MNGNDLEGHGMNFDPMQGQVSDSLSSPTEHTDSKYEFDPMSLTGSSSAPLSPPGSSSALSGSPSAPLSPPSDMVDFDGVAKHVHEASTASVSPQSPSNTAGDIFSLDHNEADPMTSSMVGNPMGDLMSSSFIGGEKTFDSLGASVSSSHDEEITLQNCDKKVPADGAADADGLNARDYMDQMGAFGDAQIALGEDMPDGLALLPPGGPVTMASLQEIGVYGAPPPEEGDDLVCLDDGPKMPSAQAPPPPLIPSTGTLIDTQAPMAPMGGNASNPFGAAEMNGAPLGNLLDDIPGQPPIAAAPPPVQPREAFVEQAPLIPSLASAPGGPAQAQAPPVFPAGPPKPPRSGGEALLLEDLMPAEGDGLPPVIPPLNLSGMAQPMEPVAAAPPAPAEPATPPVKSPPPQAAAVNGSQITAPSKSPTKKEAPQDSTKIPSPKRAKPAAATSPPSSKTAAATKTAAAPADKTAAAKKVSPTASKPAAAKSAPPKSASPRASSGTAQSPRGQATNSASPRGPASAKSPRQANSASPRSSTAKSPRTPKGYYHMYCLQNPLF